MWRILFLLAWVITAHHGNAATPAVATGSSHTLALQRDGRVLAWGDDGLGELGSGRPLRSDVPLAPVGLAGASQLVGGSDFAAALAADGAVYSWGGNSSGQLGDGSRSGRALVRRIDGLAGVSALAAGNEHMVALSSDGSIWAWGAGGMVGDGSTTTRTRPVRLVTGVVMTAISSSHRHTLALATDGSVYAWGDNDYGQLGDGSSTARAKLIRVAGLPTTVVAVSAGAYHSLALAADGTVYGWGDGSVGQLGSSSGSFAPRKLTGLPAVRAIAGGGGHSLALGVDGRIWVWGANDSGQLGDGTTTSRTTPTVVAFAAAAPVALAAGYTHSLLLDADGVVWATGNNYSAQVGVENKVQISRFTSVGGLGKVSTIAAGRDLSLAVEIGGAARLWGSNASGELGDAQATMRSTAGMVTGLDQVKAIAAGAAHSLAVREDGSLWGWGGNIIGELGDEGASRAVPAAIAGVGQVVAVAARSFVSMAVLADGSVLAFGDNEDGQLGDGTTSFMRAQPKPVIGLSGVSAVALGGRHALALKRDGTVWAWGNNRVGQLGDATTTSRLKPVQVKGLAGIVSIAAGIYHSLAVDTRGSLWQWGDGETVVTTPTQVAGISSVIDAAAGYGFSLARTSDGRVWTWGTNFLGQLGDPSVLGPRLTPALLPDMQNAAGLAAGYDHALSLKSDGTVWGWGWNDMGQLGNGLVGVQRDTTLALADGALGFVDLDPDVVDSVPVPKRPPFLTVAQKRGDLSTTSLSLTIRGVTPLVSAGAMVSAIGNHSARAARAGYSVYVVACTGECASPVAWWALPANKSWAPLGWPLSSYLDGVALGSASDTILVEIMDAADLSTLIGTRFYLGYGRDADEMLAAGRHRLIYEVSGGRN
jgi:alpha-tubulin suppressor-like RCC1 family protein